MNVSAARILIDRLRDDLHAVGKDSFRDAPPEPTTCCGRGCTGCVWESYYAAVEWWHEDAMELLSKPEGDDVSES